MRKIGALKRLECSIKKLEFYAGSPQVIHFATRKSRPNCGDEIELNTTVQNLESRSKIKKIVLKDGKWGKLTMKVLKRDVENSSGTLFGILWQRDFIGK